MNRVPELLGNNDLTEPALKRDLAVARAILVQDGIGRGGGRRDQRDDDARPAGLLADNK